MGNTLPANRANLDREFSVHVLHWLFSERPTELAAMYGDFINWYNENITQPHVLPVTFKRFKTALHAILTILHEGANG